MGANFLCWPCFFTKSKHLTASKTFPSLQNALIANLKSNVANHRSGYLDNAINANQAQSLIDLLTANNHTSINYNIANNLNNNSNLVTSLSNPNNLNLNHLNQIILNGNVVGLNSQILGNTQAGVGLAGVNGLAMKPKRKKPSPSARRRSRMRLLAFLDSKRKSAEAKNLATNGLNPENISYEGVGEVTIPITKLTSVNEAEEDNHQIQTDLERKSLGASILDKAEILETQSKNLDEKIGNGSSGSRSSESQIQNHSLEQKTTVDDEINSNTLEEEKEEHFTEIAGN